MKRLSYPIDVQIELTEACNQKCQHCYNFWRYDSDLVKKDELNADKFLLVLDKLNECGISMITLTGGEPLLRPEIFFTLLKQAKKYNMEVGLNSNAVLINKEMAEKMFEAGLDHALISVLGIESTHDSVSNLSGGFRKTCQGISNLVEAGIPVAVNMVASKL
ncbi:MAG: radical SAM protein, partial [Patescibacteria group bacterium]